MEVTSKLIRYGPAAGFVGSAFFVVASVVAAAFYLGTQNEAFSPLNHWVSELGELGVSRMALVFNVGIFVGGLALALFFAAMGRSRQSRLATAYVLVGVVAGVSGALVGVFPMNNRGIHIVMALGFFVLGWVAVGLASFDIWRRPEPRFSRWLPALGAVTVAVFLLFLSIYIPYLYTGTGDDRPAFSIATVLEWLVLFGIMGWVLLASVTWWRFARGSRLIA
jgi:hypothetical membrane protein